MRTVFVSVVVVACLGLQPGAAGRQAASGERRTAAPGHRAHGPALDEIRGADIAAHLKFLSHDLLEGRAPSTRGGQLAAEYLATQLALLGFEPAGDGGTYFQNVAIVESIVDPAF